MVRPIPHIDPHNPTPSRASSTAVFSTTPLYDIGKTYLENVEAGPRFEGPFPPLPLPRKSCLFLGHRLSSPIGVPAGPLLTSSWIELAGKLGFDVPTYKTIRSAPHPSHPLPNMVFVHADQRGATVRQTPPSDWEELTVTNSFGMPSLSPPFLLEDIGRAKQSLAPGQLLIVSVVGTLRPDRSYQDDFVAAALLAKEAGAPVIEANFSCPNVGHKEGSLYLDPDAVFRFAQSIVRAIAPLPLLIKVGAFPTPALHKEVFLAAARAGVQGIAGINSVPMQISLSPSRSAAGVCGAAIRHEALRFVRTSRELIDTERLELSLLGCGGIVLPSHFDDFLEAGAHLALSATGMMWNPYLAIEWRKIDASQRARPVPV